MTMNSEQVLLAAIGARNRFSVAFYRMEAKINAAHNRVEDAETSGECSALIRDADAAVLATMAVADQSLAEMNAAGQVWPLRQSIRDAIAADRAPIERFLQEASARRQALRKLLNEAP